MVKVTQKVAKRDIYFKGLVVSKVHTRGKNEGKPYNSDEKSELSSISFDL